MAEHRTSTLSQLYRAVSTSPELLPDTYFSLNIHDNPQANSWVYSRPTSPQPDWQRNYWVMPPFSLWTWTSPFLGTMDDVLSRIQNVESSFHSFSDKRDQAVWRGTPGVNPVSNIRLRQNLISLAEDKGWADVAELSYPRPGESGTGLRMEDHCRYKYIIYTEGVTYSGRLPYHQACASILITPPLLHHTYSTTHIRPLFSSTLDLKSANFSNGQSEKKKWAPNYSGPDESWPRSYPPGEANAIFVAHDWSDLEAVIQWLRDHADVAAGIANRQRDSVVHGGYLSQAAEACYWRALIRGWASVADVEIGNAEGQWNASEGIRFEQYLVRGKLDESSVCKGA
ncbi:MAG: hypothetical protein M1820_008987 [Bogoriella megaspora]|nr:MAG: hypothetical protein M1820_008987 [Bogoriella megaspora]